MVSVTSSAVLYLILQIPFLTLVLVSTFHFMSSDPWLSVHV